MALLLSRSLIGTASFQDSGIGFCPCLHRGSAVLARRSSRNGEHSRNATLSIQCRGRERPEGATRQRGQKQELRRNALQLYRSRFAAALTAELVCARRRNYCYETACLDN